MSGEIEIAVGTEFRWSDGDERALWRVEELGEVFGRDVARCKCIESADYEGVESTFDVDEIASSIHLDRLFSSARPAPERERECEHKWRHYGHFGGDFEQTEVVCRDCGEPAPPEVARRVLSV